MHERFADLVENLEEKFQQLTSMAPVTCASLPKSIPRAGIYLFSEAEKHLYVGRTNNLRARLNAHSSPAASYRGAAFAFLLSRESSGFLKATYKRGEGSREALMKHPPFVAYFNSSKARIRCMEVRYVEEAEPTRQALLEIYAAVILQTPYNDFDNH
jgi:hypothetical protein